jgi:hypothetical protein
VREGGRKGGKEELRTGRKGKISLIAMIKYYERTELAK